MSDDWHPNSTEWAMAILQVSELKIVPRGVDQVEGTVIFIITYSSPCFQYY